MRPSIYYHLEGRRVGKGFFEMQMLGLRGEVSVVDLFFEFMSQNFGSDRRFD